MKITLEIVRLSGNEERNVSRDGIVEGACPGCKAEPFAIVTPRAQEHDGRFRAGARCVACYDPVGWVYIETGTETIFGEQEDRAVLIDGRARVYGGTVRP